MYKITSVALMAGTSEYAEIHDPPAYLEFLQLALMLMNKVSPYLAQFLKPSTYT